MRLRKTDGLDVVEYEPVAFVDHMGSDLDVCNAARVSFDKETEWDVDEKVIDRFVNGYNHHEEDVWVLKEKDRKLLNYLARHDHWSPFAHCFLKFRFQAPIFLARQFVKHQIGFTWNEVSRRYVDNPPFYFVPDSWRRRPENMKQGSTFDDAVPIDGKYLDMYKCQAREWRADYRSLNHEGVCPEQARISQPLAMMTEWIWSGSLMAWARFVKLRIDKNAQAECWPYASAVHDAMKHYFPHSTKALLENIDA